MTGPRTGYRVFDVHLHALNPEEMKHYAIVDFGPHRKSFRQNVTDTEVLLGKTIEYLDRNGVEKSVLSDPRPLVKSWVARHPGRFLPAFWPDETVADQREAAKQFEQEAKAASGD